MKLTDWFEKYAEEKPPKKDKGSIDLTAGGAAPGGAPPQDAPPSGPAGGPPPADPAMGGQPPMDPAMGGAPPMGGMPGPEQAAPQQMALPGTLISCPSTCKFANDSASPGKCTLNRIELEQKKDGVFVCSNFEDMGSAKVIGQPEQGQMPPMGPGGPAGGQPPAGPPPGGAAGAGPAQSAVG